MQDIRLMTVRFFPPKVIRIKNVTDMDILPLPTPNTAVFTYVSGCCMLGKFAPVSEKFIEKSEI